MSAPSGLFKRVLCTLVSAGALFVFGASAQIQAKHTVRIIVPITPSGGPDIVARLLAPKLQARFDQPFFVENRPGASGTIGSEVLAKAPPDGNTLMIAPASIIIAAHLYPKLDYDVIKDLAPIANIGSSGVALLVHKSVPVKNAQQFIAWAKSNPGKLNYGSPGNGTPHHLAMELLKLQAGLELVHIPYKGQSGAVNDLIAGVVSTMFLPMPVALPLIKAGNVNLVGQTLRGRHPLFPDIPSLHEQGIKDYDVDVWVGAWAPAGVSAELVVRYNAEINALVAQPEVREQIARLSYVPNLGTPEQFAKLISSDYDKWGALIRRLKITGD